MKSDSPASEAPRQNEIERAKRERRKPRRSAGGNNIDDSRGGEKEVGSASVTVLSLSRVVFEELRRDGERKVPEAIGAGRGPFVKMSWPRFFLWL